MSPETEKLLFKLSELLKKVEQHYLKPIKTRKPNTIDIDRIEKEIKDIEAEIYKSSHDSQIKSFFTNIDKLFRRIRLEITSIPQDKLNYGNVVRELGGNNKQLQYKTHPNPNLMNNKVKKAQKTSPTVPHNQKKTIPHSILNPKKLGTNLINNKVKKEQKTSPTVPQHQKKTTPYSILNPKKLGTNLINNKVKKAQKTSPTVPHNQKKTTPYSILNPKKLGTNLINNKVKKEQKTSPNGLHSKVLPNNKKHKKQAHNKIGI